MEIVEPVQRFAGVLERLAAGSRFQSVAPGFRRLAELVVRTEQLLVVAVGRIARRIVDARDRRTGLILPRSVHVMRDAVRSVRLNWAG